MENTYKLEVPLVVDIEYGTDWYEAKQKVVDNMPELPEVETVRNTLKPI